MSMAAYQYIYTMKNVSKIYPGGREIMKNITLAFLPGAKIGVLGVNGAGKSTLLKIMAGIEQDIGGEASAANGVKVGYLSQEPQLDPAKDVLGNVMEGVAGTKALLDRFDEVSMGFGDPDADMDALLAEQAELQEKIDACNGWDLERTLEIAMDALRCPPGDAEVDKLSGGERRRVALCRLLLSNPDMLLLDEPTNHLDAESVAWLERFLAEYKSTVVAVTHDRYFLDNVAGWILELDRGRGIPYEGNYTGWLEQKKKRLQQEEREDKSRQRTLEREVEWIGQSPQARRAKSKARISAYEDLLAQSRDRAPESGQIVIPPGPRLGDLVIEAEGVTKAFGDRLLIEDLSFKLPPGGIVGIIGPNGAGKTTLFRMIMGLEQPDSGSVRIGDTVKLGYVDQSRDTLAADKTVYEEISGGQEQIEVGKRTAAGARLCGRLQLQGLRPAEEGRPALRRRTQPRASGQAAQVRRQRDPARRADQRSRRRHTPGTRGRAARLRRLCPGHQPRPLVPRPHLHPHAGVRGQLAGDLVRGQLPGLRSRPAQASGHRRRPAAPDQVQAAQGGLSRRHSRSAGLPEVPDQIERRRGDLGLGSRSRGSARRTKVAARGVLGRCCLSRATR